MGWLLKFAGGLQGQLIILAVVTASAFSGGWYVCAKFNDAAQFKALQKAVNGITKDAQQKINELDSDWREAIGNATDALEASGKLREQDSNREIATLQELKAVQDEIRRLGKKIPMLAKVGTCRLDDDFIKLWNDIRNTASPDKTKSGSESATISDSP